MDRPIKVGIIGCGNIRNAYFNGCKPYGVMQIVACADMAQGIITKRSHRASGELANHVLEVMLAFDDSSKAGRHVKIKNQCKRPAALPTGLALGQLD